MKNLLNKRWGLASVLLVLFFFIIGFIYKFSPSSKIESASFGKVVRSDILQRVTIAGIVNPNKRTLITAPYNGYVKKLFVKVGDQVKVGDPLVSIVQSLQSVDGAFPLRSPLAGTVVQIEKAEGEFVKESDPQGFILRIDDSSRFFVFANAPEIDRVKIKPGQEATIKASAILSRQYKGVIRDLSLAAREKDQWSRSQIVEFPIRVEILDFDDKIKAGMSAVMDLITDRREKVLLLRHEFIRRDEEKYFAILKSGERRDLKVGIQNEEGFEILSGLSEGEFVKQIEFSEQSENSGDAK